MTREEAIKLIEHISITFVPTDQYGDYDDPQPYEDALDMAIEALQNLSKPNNGFQGSDLISRQDAINAVEVRIKWFNGDAIEDRCKRDAFIQVIDEILTELPSADRPTGEWVSEDGTPSGAAYSVYCSRCGQWSEYRGFFCLWCGAKMGGDE